MSMPKHLAMTGAGGRRTQWRP